ncbi:MAG: hypothetical protein U0263_22855 [Polyangiaceae bacterium]
MGLVDVRALQRCLLSVSLLAALSCAGGSHGPSDPGYAEYDCPPPIGKIVREDCSRSALRYEGTSFSGSVGVGSVGASAAYSEKAIREADALVAMLKEQRVSLCNDFNTCKMGVPEYRTEQQHIDDSFIALLALKDKMATLDVDGAAKLLAEIRRIRSERGLPGQSPVDPDAEPEKVASPPFCGGDVEFKSSSNDYLHRPDAPEGVTTWSTGSGNIWSVECTGGKIKLRSWKGDYLRRTAEGKAVTTGQADEWSVERAGEKYRLRSSKGDYLIRADQAQGVATAEKGAARDWTVEFGLCGHGVRLRSAQGDYLHRAEEGDALTTWGAGQGNDWRVECRGSKVMLRSWKGDYVRRPEDRQGVVPAAAGTPGTEWDFEFAAGRLLLRSWKGDYLHRPDGAPAVTTWATGTGNQWVAEPTD